MRPSNEQSILDSDIFLQSLELPPTDYAAAMSELPMRQRRNGVYVVSNIVNDCCKNACSYRTLISYCYETDSVN